ncbi:GNAT family N-acetyltransferase [Eikenella sp. Marseille-P7795]|uniref:GNAT family N-acetyltransferase n=1 Tax=Eikenella sp. Marseille-P7795 TaxID=2866577 RepID=UPI001CE41886|nr:GNAT family N-acetyltransferase [Eikenella sp. Marseille-P7795]
MPIRPAQTADAERIGELLYQVHAVHAQARPDLYRAGARKYFDEEVRALIADENQPVFVYQDESGKVQGYAVCQFQVACGDVSLVDRKVLYLDDLCVDASQRGKKIGEQLYHYLLEFARAQGCHSLTLNVMHGNDGAERFYRRLGMTPLKTLLEQQL